MRHWSCLGLLLLALPAPAAETTRPLPKVADGWRIALLAEAPDILYPTAIVCAPDGTVYLGQDPMDMPGPPTGPIDSVAAIKGRGKERKITVFADKLHAVMGLEWIDDALYVVHPPYLSRFRDTDGDGKADERTDLVTGLGPAVPAFNGINDHVASGLRLGMDGFLYVAVGDKGIPKGVGKDGKAIQLYGGGVVRVRPDGTDLEVVATGLRNPLSTMLTAADDVFTYGNDDDSKKWPNELAHVIAGGHYGYPYQFLHAPEKCLPVVAGQVGGSGTQGLCYEEDGLPAQFRGNLFVTEWGLQKVFRYEVEPHGGTFRVKGERQPIVEAGPVGDFRPFSLAVAPAGDALLLVDWGYNGWLAKGPKAGRLYELTHAGGAGEKSPRGKGGDSLEQQLRQLGHPARAERLRAQRAVVKHGADAIKPLAKLLHGDGGSLARAHALWALDGVNTEAARKEITKALTDRNPALRAQAARALGVRRDRSAAEKVAPLLTDKDAAVRREAAIALGHIAEPQSAPRLLAMLGEEDRFVAWSVRVALRRINKWDDTELFWLLIGRDPAKWKSALLLVEKVYELPVVKALADAAHEANDAGRRRELVRILAGTYRQYEPWNGHWFGTNPLAGRFPEKTRDWNKAGMGIVYHGLKEALKDPAAEVRGEAIAGLAAVGAKAVEALWSRLPEEPDAENRRAVAAALGKLGDPSAVPNLTLLLADPKEPAAVQEAAAAALGAIGGERALSALREVVSAPDDSSERQYVVRARAVVELARARKVPPDLLAWFLRHSSARLRLAGLEAVAAQGPADADLARAVLACLKDGNAGVRRAAVGVVGQLKLRAAIPRLLELAKDDALRAGATAALARLPDPRALDVYLAGLADKNADLRRACQQALLAVRDLVAVELEQRVRDKKVPDAALPAVERVLTRFEPLVAWKVVGPFARTAPPLFQSDEPIDFAATHTGPNGVTIRWQALKGDADTGRVVLEPFKAGAGDRGGFGYDTNGSPDLNAYACAEVEAAADRDALLLVGSSGTLTLRLNGQVVFSYASFAGRAYAPDGDVVRVRLRKGVNRLVVHTRQGIGTWCFGVQASDPAQTVLAAAKVKATPDELRAFALKQDGSAERGRQLFFDGKGLGCVKCHAVEGQGGKVGPDLAGLASKYDRAEVIRSVLEPSQRIATGYQPVLIATTKGQVLAGLVREETDQHLELIDADGKAVRVKKADIDERRVSDVSLMPVGLADALGRDEFADLIAYLLSLKQPGPGKK